MKTETIGAQQMGGAVAARVRGSGAAKATGVTHEVTTLGPSDELPRELPDESLTGDTAPRLLGSVPAVANLSTGQRSAPAIRKELRLALVSLQQALEAKDEALETKDRTIMTLERLVGSQEQHLMSMSRHRDASQGQADELRRRVDDLLVANSLLQDRLSRPWWKRMFGRAA
jgi:hypothetical protein